ncbi:hypothetical protein DealDRAFT_2769, partial [Dethiobacter alkaliphilus AHT 1]
MRSNIDYDVTLYVLSRQGLALNRTNNNASKQIGAIQIFSN